MASLYELTSEWQWIAAALDDCESEEEYDAALAQLAAIEGDIAARGDGYARMMKNKQAEADALDAEIKRLQAKKKRAENVVERLKEGMLTCFAATGTDKLQTSIGTWRVQLNPPSVTITDPAKVPARFLIEQPPKVDARAILAEHKESGEIWDGIDITRKASVRFQ